MLSLMQDQLYAPSTAFGTSPNDVVSSYPPITPITMCPGGCASAQYLPTGGAGSMPGGTGGAGQSSNTLAGGVSPALPTAPKLSAATLSTMAANGTSPCACQSGFGALADVPWWALLLMGIGSIAIIGKLLRG